MSENDDAERRAESDGKNTSRRNVLRGVAAGSAAGFAGLSGGEVATAGRGATGQETTTQQDGQRAGFFERGTEVGIQMVADGDLTAPTDFAVAEGDDRQFVADQTGQVYVITPDGLRDEPFVDVSDRLVELGRFYGLYGSGFPGYDERGLTGIELHPNFTENRKFYLHYSAPPDQTLRSIQWDHIEIVSEFEATGNLRMARPNSERVLLRIPKPQYNHNAGPMAFGPDGYLYVPMGDGGGANDDMYGHAPDWYDGNTGGNGQDVVSNLLGNVLRIDVDSQQGDKPYGIPDDNPFAGDTPGLDEIYAYGFRNPFGISFDSRGRLFVPDAGQNLFEEANIVERGGNYGWNIKEGTHCFSTQNPGQPPEQCPSREPDEDPYDGGPLIDPFVEYPHQYRGEWVGIVIVGGYFYEQDTVPDLRGKYIFGDWTKDPQRAEPAGRLLAATQPEEGTQTTQTTTAQETTPEGTETGEGDGQVVPRDRLWDMEELVVAGSDDGTLDWFVRQFGRGNDGEIYVLVGKQGVPEGDSGAVLKIVPPGEGDGAATGTTTEAGGETTTEGSGGDTTTATDETTTVDTEETTTVAQDR
ncbi:PQQ-dependent sugar dehydrogenase [Halorussus salinisoli]|uniref:PQQ-dependent sugar dehydrogenase n=1 Tax=Halorussus salinisoli TaxID=2558242 RepID=UPI0010C16670|nr:PQQ-dependent sugar dehydrogenase [Halorussus salinisoli]